MNEPLVPLRRCEDDDVGRLLARGARSLRTPPIPPEVRGKLFESLATRSGASWSLLRWFKGGTIGLGSVALLVGMSRLVSPPVVASPGPLVTAVQAEPFASSASSLPANANAPVPTMFVAELPNASPEEAGSPRPRVPSGSAPSGERTDDALAREVRLLERARVRPDVDSRLALLDQHAREFPNGELALEREIFAVQTLLRAGRTNDARRRGAAIIAKNPDGPHAARVKELLP